MTAASAGGLDVPLRLVRHHLRDLPRVEVPPGYALRDFVPGDSTTWTTIQHEAEPTLPIDEATFVREFGSDIGRHAERCLFVVTEDGEPAGTITAWERPFVGGDPDPTDLAAVLAARHAARADPWGLPCWLAVRPTHQGRGLARPLVAAALERLAREHTRAYVLTSTSRTSAIRVYLDVGFEPDLDSRAAREAWARVVDTDPTLPPAGRDENASTP